MDHEYKSALYEAIDMALIMASLDRSTNVARIKVEEAVVACLLLAAALMAVCPVTSTPAETEALCAVIAKALAAQIGRAREYISANGLPVPPDLGLPGGTLH